MRPLHCRFQMCHWISDHDGNDDDDDDDDDDNDDGHDDDDNGDDGDDGDKDVVPRLKIWWSW